MSNILTLPVIIGIVAVALLLVIIASGYVKAPANKAFIISGLKKEPKILIGKAGIRIPFFERKDELILKLINVDIKTDGYIPTNDFIGVNIDAIAKVRVLTAKDIPSLMAMYKASPLVNEAGEEIPFTEDLAQSMVDAAMRNFLNMTEEEIIDALTNSLQGNMREIIGTQTLRNLCQNRKAFGEEVQAKAQKDMNALGIWIDSCNIQKLDDEENLVPSLGQDNMSQIKKNASIAKAQAERDVAIAEAEAAKASNDAKVSSEKEIAEKQNELSIRKSELQKEADTQKAIADAAYEIQKETQRKTIEITKTEADIAQQEKEVELRQKEVAVKEQTLDAEIKKQAEADRYAAQQKADAELYQRQKEAEAKQFEVQKAAEAKKAQAEADCFAKEQEAEGIKAVGEAEAAAIEAKGKAEAEAMDKKAEAYAKYNSAAVAEMMINVLPEIAGKIAEPLTQIDKITIIGGDGGSNGVDQIAGNVPAVMAKLFHSMKETVGIDLGELVKAGTYDAKVNRNVNITGLEKASDTQKDVIVPVVADSIMQDEATDSSAEEEFVLPGNMPNPVK